MSFKILKKKKKLSENVDVKGFKKRFYQTPHYSLQNEKRIVGGIEIKTLTVKNKPFISLSY